MTLQYAFNMHKVNLISRMDVHAVVSISGGDKYSKQKTKTPSDTAGGNNQTWGFPMKFTVEEASLQQNCLLDFKLVCRRALGDKITDRVSVPVKELFDGWEGGRKFVSYKGRNPDGKLKGQLTFSYQFIGNGFIGADLLSMYPLVSVEPLGFILRWRRQVVYIFCRLGVARRLEVSCRQPGTTMDNC
ncbi:Calcium-dependent lipid-binding (CaLB domain) family protein [Striga hermonthica]|uniref:Calcium-dependent lipid-binding (CaLB domain) family protein n=1 Tax=Striga hermonthica TaxID=68872 RepID=A0A9N7R7A9_STRHE|nr:Calcium-dependent lipid-binding (CaLB domain) family protein [Striga hermonthica]